ncbi:proton channel OtopLc-like [Pollicipes pollicipes]|uniref:proton channel OtopLc-like n=1 Tax=Pollicipes pollicipes TaxID=41117 RepID=UPI001884F220|nr:proton channel OtopLc-like [Pollicipes pollicipes]
MAVSAPLVPPKLVPIAAGRDRLVPTVAGCDQLVSTVAGCDRLVPIVARDRTACFRVLSLVYAKLLVVVCIAFLISEVITSNVPLYYYEGFFVYLYGGSILFLIYIFTYLLHESGSGGAGGGGGSGCCGTSASTAVEVSLNHGSGSPEHFSRTGRLRKTKTSDNDHSHGGFFLRIGAIAFGLGTMVYNGLELGSFFEIPRSSDCWQMMLAVNPCLQALFTFMQMYFIFMKSRLNIHKFKVVARFGLMHLVATNICVWVRTLVRESLRVFTDYSEATGDAKTEDFMILERHGESEAKNNCGRINIMGEVVGDASPYLFPLIIEYSLIGATVIFVMWKNIGRCPHYVDEDVNRDHVSVSSRKAHTKVDCIGVSKGLFCGLLALVIITICLVLFFVLVQQDQHRRLAIFLADTSHAGILFLMMLASLIGILRSRRLKFAYDKPDDLDAILLRVSAFGLFLYSMFCLIAAALSPMQNVPNILVLVTSALVILQVMSQLIYISDVAKRSVYLPEHDRTKPGRHVVTFLLLCNLALWLVYTFEIEKVDANPVQLNFYGRLHWAVILRVTLPLAIFHRFHSAVVLAEVWKSSYRARED